MSMAVMYWATCIALLASSTVSSTAPQVKNLKVEDENVGNWSVGNCILAKFAMNFTVCNSSLDVIYAELLVKRNLIKNLIVD